MRDYSLGQGLAGALDTAQQVLEAELAKLPDVAGRSSKEVGRAYQSLLREIEQIQPKQANLDVARKLTEPTSRSSAMPSGSVCLPRPRTMVLRD